MLHLLSPQVVLNLTSNAIKFSGGPGRAGLARVRLLRRQSSIADASPTVPLRLEVEDNGSGVPPDVAERLFTPFTQVRHRGGVAGLGSFVP